MSTTLEIPQHQIREEEFRVDLARYVLFVVETQKLSL
jgi:hypothetical protein